YDILCIQEPHWDFLQMTRATRAWTVVRPSRTLEEGKWYRAVTMVHQRLATEKWERVEVDSRDVVVVKLRGEGLDVYIYNIY
ncbi:hypothetical protein FA15DRAFT_555305, partial [Coprinopsis marcescibilis]